MMPINDSASQYAMYVFVSTRNQFEIIIKVCMKDLKHPKQLYHFT